ncbi:hypothetical protein evm_015486 [Chilo suppressalis]|nr:hypothetical protein evm_015486 [Chilo suppressalis]
MGATRNLPERQTLQRRLQGGPVATVAVGVGQEAARAASHLRAWACGVVWRAWCAWARRRYLGSLWARLPPRHRSPACQAWPACPHPRLLARADALLRHLHHRWRCRLYRANVDQLARNRMREKVTASVLFKDRKASYARSVAHPFVGDYVRLRASLAWRRGLGAGGAGDHYVVFADVAARVPARGGEGGSGAGQAGARPVLCVVSTGALLLLEPRSLRTKRRVPAAHVYRLSLSPYDDDLLAVHVRACAGSEEGGQCAAEAGGGGGGCLVGGAGRRRGDLLLRTVHVLELATKLFLVVQNAVRAPPIVCVAREFEVNLGPQTVTVSFHAAPHEPAAAPPAPPAPPAPRLVRRGSRLDVLV